MRICLTIKNFLKRWSFPLFLQWPETTSNIVEAFSFETCLNFPSQDLLKMQVAKPWHHACLHFNYSSLQHRLLFFEGSKIIQECTFSQPFIQPLNSGYIHTTDDTNQKMYFSQTPYQPFFYMQHTSRTFYNNAGEVVQQDAGAWITPLDYLGIQPFSDIPMFKKALPAPQDGVYGGFPYYLPLRHLVPYVVLAHSMFICWSLVIQCMANSLEFHQRNVWNRIQAVRLC